MFNAEPIPIFNLRMNEGINLNLFTQAIPSGASVWLD